MQNRGGQPPRSGTGSDPVAQLDAAMNETFAELAQQGSGIAPDDVLKAPQRAPREPREPRQREPRRGSREDSQGTWLDDGDSGDGDQDDDRPSRRSRPPERSSRQKGPRADPAQVILDEAETETDTDTDDADDGDAGSRRGAPQRGRDGRFLPRRADTDDDDDDGDDDAISSGLDEDEEDDDDAAATSRSGGRRYAASEEADDDESDVEPEGRGRAEDDEDEDTGTERRGRRRFPKAVKREIDRQVKAQVGKVIEERDKLRATQHQNEAAENEALDILIKAIGTREQRDELQSQVNNTRLPLEQRNRAAATLQRFLSNEKYAQTYKTALVAVNRREQAAQDGQLVEGMGRYGIRLDPKIVAEGNKGQTLIHVARAAVLAERRRTAAHIERLERQVATRRGLASQRAVSDSGFGRASMASSNGRRANGRVATVDRLRGALGFERGLGVEAAKVPLPTDRVLQQLKDGEITFADLGLSG